MKAGPKKQGTFSAEELAAMKEYAREKKAEAKGAIARAEGEKQVLAKIATFPQPDRGMAERIHALVAKHAPELSPKTWYGMPAYAKGNDVVCFFQNGQKFKTRYSTLGFSDKAMLDDGNMWHTSFALKDIGPAEEKKIAALIKKALG